MAFIQKRKAEEREQVKAAGEPGEVSDDLRPRVIVHQEEGGGFHLHWGEGKAKSEGDAYLTGLLETIEARRAKAEASTAEEGSTDEELEPQA